MNERADVVGSLGQAFQPLCFVTGASGYVGRALVPELVQACERVQGRCIAHVRPDSPHLASRRDEFQALGVHTDSTPWDPESMASRLAEMSPSHVFHLVGSTRARAAQEGIQDPYDTIDRALFAMLLGALAPLSPAPRVIYLSSRGASASSTSAYLQTRFRCEELLRASGLPFTIARPGLITGPDRKPARRGEALAALALRPAAGLLRALGLGGPASRLRPFDAGEIAYGLVHAGFNYTTIGRVLAGDELRFEQTKDREWSGPASRRDGLRH